MAYVENQARNVKINDTEGVKPTLFFQCLHLAYIIKAEVHKGRNSGKNDLENLQWPRQSIQKDFRNKMSLLVDIPKVGYDNTNGGYKIYN